MVNVTRLLETGDVPLQWIDRAKTILDIATRAGTMYLGYNAFERHLPGSGLSGAIVSQIAMKLATTNNLAAGAAGVATLSSMGILNLIDLENQFVPAKAQTDYISLLLGWIKKPR
ncbi:unnamed protein product [marine sediment metagenome]|uniref:Uncharacterized protein n=1 Tax=marine sediment metagenome TaxID=412755 RepID=X0ZYI6_9ZZZZ